MTQHATCAFTIDTWQADPYDDRDGIALSRTRVTKTFTGELAGTSTAELLMAMAPHESASYVGFERIEGSIAWAAGQLRPASFGVGGRREADRELDDCAGHRDGRTGGHPWRRAHPYRARRRPYAGTRL